MSKKSNKKSGSTRETFKRWLSECGNDLFDYDGILSCSGSDGPDIKADNLDGVPFSDPEAIERYLVKEELYKKQMVMCGDVEYNPPVVHYIDWIKKNVK